MSEASQREADVEASRLADKERRREEQRKREEIKRVLEIEQKLRAEAREEHERKRRRETQENHSGGQKRKVEAEVQIDSKGVARDAKSVKVVDSTVENTGRLRSHVRADL